MSYSRSEVTRDGFSYGYDRFYTEPDRVERVEASSLRSMFLPRLSFEGRKMVNGGYSGSFVRGQLKHYGVEFDEKEISGNGTHLMKKVLQAGKCDKVPDNITKLRKQMRAEWLDRLTPEQVSSQPEWTMDKYFLSSGKPDRAKTTTIVGIPFDQSSSYRSGQMREAASKVAGLHQETGMGPKTQTIFMGWNPAAVSKAAKGHAAREAKEFRVAQDEIENERAEMHTSYLDTIKRKKSSKNSKTYSPIGSYIVNCEEIEGQWPDQADDLSLDIRQTKEPGVFEASFEFGILEGIMIISAEKNTLERYYSQLDREAESDSDETKDEDEDENEVENNKKPTTCSKRKSQASHGRGRPSKKPEAGTAKPRTYLLKLKCRETGEGEIYSTAKSGTLKFKDEKLASLIGKVDLPIVGRGISFTARKTSDTPASSGDSWADFSEKAYEHARGRRWG